jgi:hypothetical protein
MGQSELLLLHYKHGDEFITRCRDAGLGVCRWFDLNILLSLLVGLISKHDRLLTEGGIQSATYFKGHFRGLWRCVPFVDTAAYIKQLDNEGIPCLQASEHFFPRGTSPESLLEITEKEDDELTPAVRRAVTPWVLALQTVGLERQTHAAAIADLVGVASRGAKAHRAANESEGDRP